MRATRAYLAGFGTAGCLLAAAAVFFVLASAFVSFEGFPAVSANARVGQIVVQTAAREVPVSSRRVLLAFRAPGRSGDQAAPLAHRAGAPAGPFHTGTAPASMATTQPSQKGPAFGTSSDPAVAASTSSPAPASPTTSTTGSALGGAVDKLGSKLTKGLSTTATHLEGTVSSTLGGTGTTVSTVSPSVGSTASPVSGAAAGTVASVAGAVTTTASNLTGAVGHALGGN